MREQSENQEIIAKLNAEICRLEAENKALTDNVKWMHDTIWELIREKRQAGQAEAAMAKIEPPACR